VNPYKERIRNCTLLEHLNSPTVFIRVLVTPSLVFCAVIVLLSLFLVAVFSVILRFTVFNYPLISSNFSSRPYPIISCFHMEYVCLNDLMFANSSKKMIRRSLYQRPLIQLYKGNNKITELRTILQRESQNS
jgi:hypothetical protein